MIEEELTATDPVCGMSVNIEHAIGAGLTAEHDEAMYYFCGKGCKFEFNDDREKYLAPSYTPSMSGDDSELG